MFSLKVTEDLELRLLEYRHVEVLFDLIESIEIALSKYDQDHRDTKSKKRLVLLARTFR